MERYTSLARLHYPWAAPAPPPPTPPAASTDLLPSFPTYLSSSSANPSTTTSSPSPERKRRSSSKDEMSPPVKKNKEETGAPAPTLRPPPCLTTPPSVVTPVDIRLPTQPLDIKELAELKAEPPVTIENGSSNPTNVLRSIRTKVAPSSPEKKKQFVRPFEDDYNTDNQIATSAKNEDSNQAKPENEAKITTVVNNNNNIVLPPEKGKSKEKESKVEQRSVSKEKLKYLRYFRLGNRKQRHGKYWLESGFNC